MSKSWRNASKRIPIPNVRASTTTQSKPAFSVKPFAPVPTNSGWSSSSGLAQMRHPSNMTSEELGLASVSAAREQVDSPKLWALIAKRASEIADTLEPRDIALLLNGMSRMRTLTSFGPQLLPTILPTIEKKLPYFSSIQIAMLISAISKLPSTNQTLPPSLIKEIKSRVHEFLTPVEISMLMTALVKLGISDASLFTRLSSFIQSRMHVTPYHVRELSVIAHAFASANFRDVTLFERVFEKSQPTLSEATPVEFARLIAAFLKIQISSEITDSLIRQTTEIFADRFKYMTAGDLVSTVFAFASICEHHHEAESLSSIFSALKHSFLTNFSILQPKDIAAILTSFSRWRISMTNEEFSLLFSKLTSLRPDRIDSNNAIIITASLAGISPETSILPVLKHMYPSILAGVDSHQEWSSLARAAILVLNTLPADQIVSSLTRRIVHDLTGFKSLDRSTRSSMIDTLKKILGHEHDLVLAICE
jgi:hypothetical protein